MGLTSLSLSFWTELSKQDIYVYDALLSYIPFKMSLTKDFFISLLSKYYLLVLNHLQKQALGWKLLPN